MTEDETALEPLEQLARFAWEQAPALCPPEQGCCDYHRCWSLVRWLKLGAALPSNSDFYHTALGSQADRGRTRTLISGAADTGLMAMVLADFAAKGVSPDLLLVDRCPTPIAQCRQFASLRGRDVQLLTQDITQLETHPVDTVVAHSFLHFFSDTQRTQVMAAWARLLKKGGQLLLTNSLAVSEQEGPPDRDPESIANQVAELAEQVRAAGWPAHQVSELNETLTRFWSRNWWRRPYITEDSLLQNLQSAGFSVEFREIDRGASVAPSRAFGTVPGRRRVKIIAVKK